MRLAMIIHELGGGGAPRSSILAAAQLHHRGHHVEIHSLAGGQYVSEIPKGISVHDWSIRAGRLWAPMLLAAALWRRAASTDLDAVVTHSPVVSRLCLAVFRVARRPSAGSPRVVVVERSTLSASLQNRFPNRFLRGLVLRLTRWLYRKADFIVGVSVGVSRDLEWTLNLPAGSVTTIYNPLDVERIAQCVQEDVPADLESSFKALIRPVVISVGRLVSAKAHRDLIEAFAELPPDQRGSLVVLGEGPLRGDLERQISTLDIDSRVWMPGFVDNPWWFAARADVFVLSSHWEGHPRAVLEALACGLPVVATDCPSGPREILQNVTSALLVPVGSPSEITAAISELLSSEFAPPDIEELERYSPSAVGEQFERVLAIVTGRLLSPPQIG